MEKFVVLAILTTIVLIMIYVWYVYTRKPKKVYPYTEDLDEYNIELQKARALVSELARQSDGCYIISTALLQSSDAKMLCSVDGWTIQHGTPFDYLESPKGWTPIK